MGPLPPLHKFSLAVLVLLVSLAGGIWLATLLDLPAGGIGAGIGVGLQLAWLLTHDFGHPRERPVRITRRR